MPRLSAREINRLGPEAREQVRQALRAPDAEPGNGSPIAPLERTPSKYRNVRTTIDGFTFASQREAARYGELKLELLAGTITDLELQKTFL